MVDIDLTAAAEERRALTRQLMSRVDRPDSNKPYGIYFLSSGSDWAPLARFVERSVFLEQFGNDEAEMAREYDRFEPSSFFILAVDHESAEPIGTLRMIEQSEVGLKTLCDVQTEPAWGATPEQFVLRHCGPDDESLVLDIATLAVRSEWSTKEAGLLTAAALYSGVYRCTFATGCRQLIAALDEVVADLLRAFSVPLDLICDMPAIEYLGSPATAPYVIQLDQVETIVRTDQKLMGLVFGTLIDDKFSLPPLDLDNPNLHPTEMEPQFLETEPEPSIELLVD